MRTRIVAARLAQLLSAFREAADAYALARLEFATEHPRIAAPPALRLGGDVAASRDCWDFIEAQTETARRFVEMLGARSQGGVASDAAGLRLRARVRELDRYARAVRVVLTVEERGDL
jgi:hypothetical protein